MSLTVHFSRHIAILVLGLHAFLQFGCCFHIQSNLNVFGNNRYYKIGRRTKLSAEASNTRDLPKNPLRLTMSAVQTPIDIESNAAETSEMIFACPQCGTATNLKEPSCSSCGAPFTVSPDGFVDLTPEATSATQNNPTESQSSPLLSAVTETFSRLQQNPLLSSLGLSNQPMKQELFRSPFVSFLYERG